MPNSHGSDHGSDEQHHSKIKGVFTHVMHKLNNWLMDGPPIRNFHPFHMELIEHDIEDMDERQRFAKVRNKKD